MADHQRHILDRDGIAIALAEALQFDCGHSSSVWKAARCVASHCVTIGFIVIVGTTFRQHAAKGLAQLVCSCRAETL